MGKRKERRLAALGNSNRRVKLDLFAEPSGDLGGSSLHDEVEGNGDPTQRAGLPTSPSSSDQQPQNPLLLLGQYNDDELDDEKNQDLNHGTIDSLSAALTKQDIHPADGNEKDSNGVVEPAIQSDEQQDMDGDSIAVDAAESVKQGESKDSDTTAYADTSKPLMLAEKASVGGASTPLVAGDVILGWMMVVHDETNQYYYWNTETGETSWEVPIALAQMGYTLNHQTSVAESTSLPVSESYNNSIADVGGISFPVSTVDSSTVVSYVSSSEGAHGSMRELYASYQQVENEPLKDERFATHSQQNELESNTISVHAQLGDVNSVQDEPIPVAGSSHIQNERTDSSSSLSTHCQCLLERVKSLTGFERPPQDRERIFKYISEVETRLFDIESLSSYGLSMLPFWMHSQGRLKQLEDTINNEIYQLAVSAQLDYDFDKSIVSCEAKGEKQNGLFRGSLLDGPGNSKQGASFDAKNSSHNEGASGSVAFDVHVSPSIESAKLPENATMSAERNETANFKSDSVSIEDVDMDIDMEVEDVPTNTTTSENVHHSNSAPAQQSIPSNLPAELPSLVAGESSAVPLPEEWIHPPPPDTELVPPPPPDDDFVPPLPLDEPPDSSYSMLPCSGQMVQPMSYTEHYGFAYVDPSSKYYCSAANFPSGYVHIDGSQAAIPQASLYYGPVSTTYSETPPVEQVASYDLQTVPPGTLVTGLESSNLPTNFGTVQSDSSHGLDTTGSVNAGSHLKPESLAVGIQIDSGHVQPSSNMNNQAPDLSSNKGTVSAAASAPSSNAKVQSKVSRGKKRTVAVATSLRSNKKVSSLVDKWKAVKEEMHEDEEDEPENTLEILEKKRQKEIEAWRAKQITTGEAKDNANFQPLGGDWREKVKRRRALAAKEEDGKKQAEAGDDAKPKKPDLAQLSRGLPSCWLVYWDEASKQVYYGNAITSETSWTRPPKS